MTEIDRYQRKASMIVFAQNGATAVLGTVLILIVLTLGAAVLSVPIWVSPMLGLSEPVAAGVCVVWVVGVLIFGFLMFFLWDTTDQGEVLDLAEKMRLKAEGSNGDLTLKSKTSEGDLTLLDD